MSKRKNHAPMFKAKVALATLSGEKTLSEVSSDFGVHQTLINKWVKQLKESAPDIFSGSIKSEESKKEKEVHELHAKIGQLRVNAIFYPRPGGRSEHFPQAKYGHCQPCTAQYSYTM